MKVNSGKAVLLSNLGFWLVREDAGCLGARECSKDHVYTCWLDHVLVWPGKGNFSAFMHMHDRVAVSKTGYKHVCLGLEQGSDNRAELEFL